MLTDTRDAPPRSEPLLAVREASRAWIRHFNAGEVAACVDGYAPSAIMEATPLGRFVGRDAIADFWRPFLAQGAGRLAYHDVRLRVVDTTTVELSARWSMNVGRGVITCERWAQQADGIWRLTYDAFEIQQRHEAGGSTGSP